MASSGNGNGKGRKKIKMEKMKNESNLQVTFSKRRKGAIRKAHELTILTGAEVAFIVFSPGGKVYSFGHPSLELVTNRFLNGISQPLTPIQQQIQNKRNRRVADTNASLANVKNQLEFERNNGEVLDRQLNASQGRQGGLFDVDKQNLPQLQQSLVSLQNFSEEVDREIDARVLRGQQNYGVPTGGYYYSREGGLASLPLMGDIYDGSGSGLTALTGPFSYGGNRGGFFPFPMGHGGYRVGGSVGVVRSQAGLGSYESGGNWTSSAGSSSFGGGGGGGGGPSIAGPSSLVGGAGGGWPLSARHGSFGGSGGQSFTAGPSSLPAGGGGLPTTSGASSFGVGHDGGSSNARVSDWDDLMPLNRFGGSI